MPMKEHCWHCQNGSETDWPFTDGDNKTLSRCFHLILLVERSKKTKVVAVECGYHTNSLPVSLQALFHLLQPSFLCLFLDTSQFQSKLVKP